MKHEYEDIVSMLTLPETIAQTLLLLPGVLLHLGNNIGFVRLSLGVSACSQSCLLSFPFYAIPIQGRNQQVYSGQEDIAMHAKENFTPSEIISGGIFG